MLPLVAGNYREHEAWELKAWRFIATVGVGVSTPLKRAGGAASDVTVAWNDAGISPASGIILGFEPFTYGSEVAVWDLPRPETTGFPSGAAVLPHAASANCDFSYIDGKKCPH